MMIFYDYQMLTDVKLSGNLMIINGNIICFLCDSRFICLLAVLIFSLILLRDTSDEWMNSLVNTNTVLYHLSCLYELMKIIDDR